MRCTPREQEIATYTENIEGNGSKDGEEDESWAVCTDEGKYHGSDAEENSKHNRGSNRVFRPQTSHCEYQLT